MEYQLILAYIDLSSDGTALDISASLSSQIVHRVQKNTVQST